MSVPTHHKELAKHLRERCGEPASVVNYRDNQGCRPVPIGAFGSGRNRFYSTIGWCDGERRIPRGQFELAAVGELDWLPNALCSSVYWLEEREIIAWPMVCEDVVKDNVKGTFRHMGYVPSTYSFAPSSGEPILWLLGVPLKDSEILIGLEDLQLKVAKAFPDWIINDIGQHD